jgi:ATP-dependent DNA helicase RecG
VNTDLATSLGRQETATLEFKRAATDLDTLRKTICAMSNDLTGAGGRHRRCRCGRRRLAPPG